MRFAPALAAALLCAPALVAQEKSGADSFSVFPGYERFEHEEDNPTRQFDAHEMWDGKKWVSREGRYMKRGFFRKEGTVLASPLQIGRNLANALKAAGGTVLFQGDTEPEGRKEYIGGEYHVYGKATQKGRTVWFLCYVYNNGENYELRSIEEEALAQSITASAMADALQKDGFIALDIHFDTGKATLKADSQALVDQIAELLKGNPALKVGIEGHTDNTGTPAGNKKLSEDRAKAVVAAVAAKGVQASRMSAVGWGQEKPVADNRSEEGRAKNRRVEVVKK